MPAYINSMFEFYCVTVGGDVNDVGAWLGKDCVDVACHLRPPPP